MKGLGICHFSLWKTQKGWQIEIMAVKKWRKRSGFVLYLYFNDSAFTAVRAIFVWPWKMVSVRAHYLFYQPMDEKIKTWTLSFSAKDNPITEKVSFDWPIVLQYNVKAKYQLISRKFSGMIFFSPERSLNQSKATHVCHIRSINQSNRTISVRLLFLFCSLVFISRSYENRSKRMQNSKLGMWKGYHFSIEGTSSVKNGV